LLRFIWVKKMLLLVVIITVLSSSLSGCRDMFYGERPFDYPNAVWICEDPYIVYKIEEDDLSTAYIETDDQVVAIDLLFGYGTDVDAVYDGETYINDKTLLFRGECIFGKKRFIINLTKDNYWGGKYDRLVFKRVE